MNAHCACQENSTNLLELVPPALRLVHEMDRPFIVLSARPFCCAVTIEGVPVGSPSS